MAISLTSYYRETKRAIQRWKSSLSQQYNEQKCLDRGSFSKTSSGMQRQYLCKRFQSISQRFQSISQVGDRDGTLAQKKKIGSMSPPIHQWLKRRQTSAATHTIALSDRMFFGKRCVSEGKSLQLWLQKKEDTHCPHMTGFSSG